MGPNFLICMLNYHRCLSSLVFYSQCPQLQASQSHPEPPREELGPRSGIFFPGKGNKLSWALFEILSKPQCISNSKVQAERREGVQQKRDQGKTKSQRARAE